MLLSKNDKLVIIGDSVTDCGRRQPVGEGLGDSMGNGYANLVNSFLTAVYPQLGIRVINMGTSGNTVRDLKARWQRDVLDLNPDWLSICIGINDVWLQYDQPLIPESHVYLPEYEATLTELVALTRPRLKGLILMTPYYMEPNRADQMRASIDQYGAAVKRIAAAHDCILVDTQAAFDAVFPYIYPATLGWDRVHPNAAGHAIMARAFLGGVRFEW
ncbi:MAG: SGNH/GDSL hydrolase family protein [Mycobacterium leprae]